jgi:hypothetical protein
VLIPREIVVGHKRPSSARKTPRHRDMHLFEAHFERARNQRDFRVMFQPRATSLIPSLLVMEKQQVKGMEICHDIRLSVHHEE